MHGGSGVPCYSHVTRSGVDSMNIKTNMTRNLIGAPGSIESYTNNSTKAVYNLVVAMVNEFYTTAVGIVDKVSPHFNKVTYLYLLGDIS